MSGAREQYAWGRGLYREVGAAIRDARMERGLRQEDLASLLGIGRSTLTHWEKGRVRVNIADLYLIASALERSVVSFLPLKEPPK